MWNRREDIWDEQAKRDVRTAVEYLEQEMRDTADPNRLWNLKKEKERLVSIGWRLKSLYG